MTVKRVIPAFLFALLLSGCASGQKNIKSTDMSIENIDSLELDTATFGAGCFWCVEAVFQDLKGVQKVESGYSGGHVKNPSYREVTGGKTGHVEVARIWFDSSIITYDVLLEVLWHSHDPTTMNRQGADVGTQYRSVIYYHNEDQQSAAEASKTKTDSSGLWGNPIVTSIEPLENYYPAEDYHQNYFNNNSNQPYCAAVIGPKVQKVRKEFKHLLKNP
jgi:peptide-methionine (S)-S-oxide reductase